MLKQATKSEKYTQEEPAAFRRLCVETHMPHMRPGNGFPAAFRRLCVETFCSFIAIVKSQPAAFRRLCVETKMRSSCIGRWAVQPPSGGCVLKLSYG